MKKEKFEEIIKIAQESQKTEWGFWYAVGTLEFHLSKEKLTINPKQFKKIVEAMISEDFNKIIF